MLLDNEEAFYGGAAGGGKSDALLMAGLQYADTPGYAAIIFRRTYSDLALPGALMDRAQEWLGGSDCHWNGSEKIWTFPSGASLSFGYMDGALDHFRYQSSEFQFCGFDELTQFRETQYRYMFSRLRRLAGSDIPIRMRGASNPGGIGHDWVKQRFITERLREDYPQGRPFIPAKLGDNPFLDREVYTRTLQNLDPVTKAQLLNGDWSVRPAGGLFRREWFRFIESRPVDLRWVRYWDLASTEDGGDWTAGCLLSRDRAGMYYLGDMRRMQGRPAKVEALIKQTAQLDGPETPVYIEQEPGASGKAVIDSYIRLLAGYVVRPQRPTGDKLLRAGPVSSQAEGGNVTLVRGNWNGDFLDELEAFPQGSHDDQVDALSGAFSQVTGRMIDFGHLNRDEKKSRWND